MLHGEHSDNHKQVPDSFENSTIIKLDNDEYTLVNLDEDNNGDSVPSSRTPLAIATSEPPSWRSYLTSILPSPKTILTCVASVITTLPPAVYAFAFPLNVIPESLTWELWSSLPIGMKMLAIAFTLTCLGIGSLMRYQHLPTIATRLQEIVKSYCADMPAFLKNNFILLMSGLAAISSLALGYYGFLWGGQTLAVGVAAVNFLMTFGFRIESMSALINKIRNVFDKDQQFQNELINQLKRIKPEHIEGFESSMKAELNGGNTLDEEIIRKCLLKLYDKTEYIDLNESNSAQNKLEIFNPPRMIDNIKNFLHKTIDLGLGTIIGGATLILFTQYGYDGIRILIQLPTNSTSVEDLPYAAQLSLGLLAASSSGVLGFMSGMDITNTITSAYDYMKNTPTNIIKVVIVSVGSGISATSLAGATSAMIDKPNLFNLIPKSVPAYLLTGGNWLFATAFDINAILRLITKNDATKNNAIHWLEKHKLSDVTISSLRQHSYFKKQIHESTPLLVKERKDEEMLELRLSS